jgi:competence protein ComEC
MLPWDRTIDTVVITHPHADHEGGLTEVLKRYDVGVIYETGVLGSNDLRNNVHALAQERGTEICLISETVFPPSHDSCGGEPGRGLKVLAPDSSLLNKKIDNLNSASIVLFLTYGQTSILLTGDAPFDEEDEILDDLFEPIDVLKIAHHGSVTSTSREFLEIIKPRYAIISVGEENDYGHPHPATLERLKFGDSKIFRTDEDGDILITSDGGEPTVESRPLPF